MLDNDNTKKDKMQLSSNFIKWVDDWQGSIQYIQDKLTKGSTQIPSMIQSSKYAGKMVIRKPINQGTKRKRSMNLNHDIISTH